MGLRVPGTSSEPWEALLTALDDGHPLAEACAAARLDRAATARLTAPETGAWVELIDGLEGGRVLVAEHQPGHSAKRMAREAAVVGIADDDEARAHFRQRWLGEDRAAVILDTEERLAAGCGPWDLVIIDGLTAERDDGEVRSLGARLRRLSDGLAPHGRLVVVADNRLSPLRMADVAIGRAAGPAGPSLRSIERALRGAGLTVSQRFGLLRSSVDGVTAFDLDAPAAAAAVMAAAAVNIEHFRAVGFRLLHHSTRQRAAARVVPAWMIVASSSATPWMPSPPRPTGRLGHKGSEESKILRGEPPVELEKRYSTPEAAATEGMALRVLEARGLNLAPRVLSQPSADRIRHSWLPGQPLRPAGLRREMLRTWVGRAAQTIGVIQQATRRSDGTVLVHGDYWLGNLLVDAGEVVAVLDWTRAHWGESTEDARHLVDHLVEMGLASGHDIESLRNVARAGIATPNFGHRARMGEGEGEGEGP